MEKMSEPETQIELKPGRCGRVGCSHPHTFHIAFPGEKNEQCRACGCTSFLEIEGQMIQYLPDKIEDADLAGWTGPGWYFWSDPVTCVGPYESGEHAHREAEAFVDLMTNGDELASVLAHTPMLKQFAILVAYERKRQDTMHPGTGDLPDGSDHFNPGGRRTWEDIARHAEKRAAREGRLTFSHVFEEEAAEVLTAAAEGDIEKLKSELVQVSAVALKWLQAIARRERKPVGCPTLE